MKQTEMKSNVLQQLIESMLGETGGRMKPKMVSIEVIKPMKGEGSLEDVLDEAAKNKFGREKMSKDEGDIDGDGDHDIHDHALEKEADMYDDAKEGKMDDDEDCEDEKKPRMSLKEFLSRK